MIAPREAAIPAHMLGHKISLSIFLRVGILCSVISDPGMIQESLRVG